MPFKHDPNNAKPGPRNLKKSNKVTSGHLSKLIEDLKSVEKFYEGKQKWVEGIFVDVYYNDIIAKSGRIQELFKQGGDCNNTIVGARFSDSTIGNENHIITHYVSLRTLKDALYKLEVAHSFLESEMNGEANSENFNDGNLSINYSLGKYNKTKIRNIIIDCSVILALKVPSVGKKDDLREQLVITFFKTELDFSELLDKIGLDRNKYWYDLAGANTISASLEAYQYLIEKVPFLISMVATDISSLRPADFNEKVDDNAEYTIPSPSKEPIIGVIDTLFDQSVYFSEWVDYRETLEPFEEAKTEFEQGYGHGTAVSSLIVDGPSLNPWLDDGLGRFKVRHFGVCLNKITLTRLIKKIKKIITENQDIRVWNLSLGTENEISKNFISFGAAELDRIQEEKNVIFIVAGTNDNRKSRNDLLRIGSPADSLNALVVNSVKRDGSPASYSRTGKVLSFFNKPDVSYFGGDYEIDERLNVYTHKGLDKEYGTSFAAPWISRKMCYLIDVIGFTREIAKALIIDAAAGWDYKQGNCKYQNIIGYGVVPKKMSNIISCDNSEIKFILQDTSNTYITHNYALPIPKDENGKSPYVARATLCYFPECNRLEGVDYTQRELSLKFGRMGKREIKDINKNIQDTDGEYIDERKARRNFRKWENTKFISGIYKETGMRPLLLYGEGLWGVSLTSKERRKSAKQKDLNFGLVVTIRNIKGINKINEFKHACLLRGYIVNEVNITQQVDIYEKALEELKFEQ